MRKSYAVLGGGRFGGRVAQELYDSGEDVILIEKDPDIVNRMSERVTTAICGDISDENVLKSAGVADVDAAVIALATLEPAILAVLALKEMGVKTIVAKAKNESMGQILEKVGATKVIYPEREAATRLARVLNSSGFLDYFHISENVSIIEMLPKKEWVGKNLKQLDLRQKYRINVVAIKEKDDVKAYVDPDAPLKADRPLLIMVHNNDLKKIQ